MKLQLFLEDPITYLKEGWQYVGMQEYCRKPPCEHATYCRGTYYMVENCKNAGHQGARYQSSCQKVRK